MNKNTVPVLRPQPLENDIHPLIAGRWSTRAFDADRPVDKQILDRLFEAARWAPSAMNVQSWRFLSFGPENPEALGKARECLMPGNAWALNAPRLLFVMARTSRPGGKGEHPWAKYEAGMAAYAMALQAADCGLAFHQMAGFDGKKLRADFSIPDDFAVITAAAVGWPASADVVPENKRAMETEPRQRRPLGSIVFSDGQVPQD